MESWFHYLESCRTPGKSVPELPEAETIARGLRTTVVGESINRVQILHVDILRQPKSIFSKQVRFRRINGVDRRGKNILLLLDSDQVIKVNLGMTGRLLPFSRSPQGTECPTHPVIQFGFYSGALLVFDDVRRLGSAEALTTAEWKARANLMGPEPLDSTYQASDLLDGLRNSSSPIRSWLLDQKRIAGIGNIYANEALYLAQIHPQKRAQSLTKNEATSLYHSLRKVLNKAIDAGGTTIQDYRNINGDKGKYAQKLSVYGKEGDKCPKCNSLVQRIVFGNRSAFYCPLCQPLRSNK